MPKPKTLAPQFEVFDYPVTELLKCLNPNNPRFMPTEQKKSLQASLKQFGVVEPVVLNILTGRIVGGHERIQAALLAGHEYLPVVEVSLTPPKELALNLFLNKVKGEWDYQKTAQMLAIIPEEELIETGFTTEEVEKICSAYNVAPEGLAPSPKEPLEGKPPPEDIAIIRFGQFKIKIPGELYDKWVENLSIEAESLRMKDTPQNLGSIVVKKLGVTAA